MKVEGAVCGVGWDGRHVRVMVTKEGESEPALDLRLTKIQALEHLSGLVEALFAAEMMGK